MIVEGRYLPAVEVLLSRKRYAEAARLEAWRGKADRAAKLYERAGDMRGAASVYMTLGDFEMAALMFKEGGLLAEAGDAFQQAGRTSTALDLFIEAGEHGRALDLCRVQNDEATAAAILAKMGRPEDGARILAERAHANGQPAVAAGHWEEAGDVVRAAEAWVRAGEPMRAGQIHLEAGDNERAAPLLLEGGAYLAAAKALVANGQVAEAAQALYRGGHLARAARMLRGTGQLVILARMYVKHGHNQHAYKTLRSVPHDSPQVEEAHLMLVDMLERDGLPDECVGLLEGLVRNRIQSRNLDDEVRTWVVRLAANLFRQGQVGAAIQWLKRLEVFRLSTPELKQKIEDLEKIQGTGSTEKIAAAGTELVLPRHPHYTFQKVLGAGSNGVVYKALDGRLNRTVAIKMIGRTALPNEVARQFFLREAQTAAGLNHPNIVTIYDIGEISELPFIAMEFISGESLAEMLIRENGSMAPLAVLPICQELCGALDYAHKHGVVHRDVKLENVMLTEDGDIKLMDFGLAKAMTEAPDRSLVITGTPLYMSPEQILGRDVDHRTDIYALGVMLYRLLVGRWPYYSANVLKQHRRDPVPSAHEQEDSLPKAFDMIIRRTMAKNADDRYERAGQVALAMDRLFLG